MIALVLAHAGLDVSLDLELGAPGADRGAVRHRGGDRLVVTAPADRAALEWALTLADRTVVLTVGPPEAENVMTWALGRGAMGAVRIWDEAIEKMDLPAMARVIEAAVGRITPDVIVAGERGLAGATGALPALVAARLGWPCVDGAHRLTREAGVIVAERRLPGGRREELAIPCPSVVTVTPDSVEPRYVSVRARRDAARREHETWSLTDIGLAADTVRAAVRLRVGGIDWPRPRPRRTAAALTAAPARSAAERLRQLVAGGPAATRSAGPAPPASRLLEGDPGAIADRIVAFLEQHRFV